ncbi:MAG: hypothetical protein A4E60_01396 [Syntrophorhabdus sp. PtaB.Bin047]|jgi:hypothetical protein|nr:MAG: hypothetical protein A4E60_01396 [Syntrophorhabdus sp. PtaB.Bin047]
MQTIVRNSLISRRGLQQILSLPEEDVVYVSLLEILTKFQDIKQFASEIHTEIHLIKPILKILGYAYESKPKYFNDSIKGPDVALFATEADRDRTSPLWGTPEYYMNTLGVLLLKRFGRNLEEGVSGFYLEFENRIPSYQLFYFLKNTKTPWGILTNGKQWMLMKKPLACETRVFSVDLEEAIETNDRDALHLFCRIFSVNGLSTVLPELEESERQSLIDRLKEKKTSLRNATAGFKKKTEVFPRIVGGLSDLFAEDVFAATRAYLAENDVYVAKRTTPPDAVDEFNVADIASYLLNKKGASPVIDPERIFLHARPEEMTKDDLLTMKMLDMTPGFGNVTTQLVDGIAYLSFILPYRDRNTFVARWEDERTLKRYILERILYGIEKSHVAYDILQYAMQHRYGTEADNYRFGNPLIGMSLSDIAPHVDTRNQMGLFAKNPLDIIKDVREMYRQYFSLSDKIREDMAVKEEIALRLRLYCERLRDIMDLITATYFSKAIDERKIQESLVMLDSDNASWDSLVSRDWFAEAKRIARRSGFFHLEIEFPFLVDGAYDYIFVQPSLTHIWEDPFPLPEVTKAHIKRGMTYLKPQGTMVLILDSPDEDLLTELSRSKRYDTRAEDSIILLRKKKMA